MTERIAWNALMAALAASGDESLAERMDCVRVGRGEPLPASTASASFSYFPVDAVLAMLVVDEHGETAATAIVGSEGGVYVPYIERAAPSTPTTLIGGLVYRVEAELVRRILEGDGGARMRFRCYADCRLVEGLTLTACSGVHLLEPRLCFLLLRLQDLVGDICRTTQELLALTLGVRRPTITVALRALASRCIIDTQRGALRVRSRAALEQAACGCYRLMADRLRDVCGDRILERSAISASAEHV